VHKADGKVHLEETADPSGKKWVKRGPIGESLDPGTSAIIAIAEDRVVERLATGLAGYEKIARHALSDEAAATIVAEVEAE